MWNISSYYGSTKDWKYNYRMTGKSRQNGQKIQTDWQNNRQTGQQIDRITDTQNNIYILTDKYMERITDWQNNR